MSKPDWTPGPWVVGSINDTAVFRVGADQVRYTIAVAVGDHTEPDSWPAARATARLIAAAPDLYEALRELLNALPSATTNPAIKTARAAIAKAEGRE